MTLEELSQTEVITPSKGPGNAFQTPAAIYVITGEDIRRSGATTIPAAIRLAPGVEVARIDGSKWSVGIRGFGSRLARSVLVLIDGRSVYTPLFAGTYWEVQDTLLEDVDRIEVIRGPAGTCLVKLFAFECLAEFSPILHFAGAVSNCRCRSLRPNLRMFVRI